jgi:hypothetical protein
MQRIWDEGQLIGLNKSFFSFRNSHTNDRFWVNFERVFPVLISLCLKTIRSLNCWQTVSHSCLIGALRDAEPAVSMVLSQIAGHLSRWCSERCWASCPNGAVTDRSALVSLVLWEMLSHSCLIGALTDGGGAVGWSTALQGGRSWVRFPMGVIGIFHWLNPTDRTMVLRLTQPLTEMSTRKDSRCVGLTTLPPSCNLGALTSRKPQGLPRPVEGLLYLYSGNSISTPSLPYSLQVCTVTQTVFVAGYDGTSLACFVNFQPLRHWHVLVKLINLFYVKINGSVCCLIFLLNKPESLSLLCICHPTVML